MALAQDEPMPNAKTVHNAGYNFATIIFLPSGNLAGVFVLQATWKMRDSANDVKRPGGSGETA
jgi:hypothetical protein